MLFDVAVEIKIPGMETASTVLSVEAPTVAEAVVQAPLSVTVTVLSVNPNADGVPVSVAMKPIALSAEAVAEPKVL